MLAAGYPGFEVLHIRLHQVQGLQIYLEILFNIMIAAFFLKSIVTYFCLLHIIGTR